MARVGVREKSGRPYLGGDPWTSIKCWAVGNMRLGANEPTATKQCTNRPSLRKGRI